MTEENGNKAGKLAGISIAINILLAIGMIILFVKYFGDTDNAEKEKSSVEQSLPENFGNTGSNVAFVNTDVLLERYELVKQMAVDFEREQRKRDADLKNKTEEYQNDAAYFQQSIENGSLSETSAQTIYKQLMQREQALYELQNQYSNELAQQDYEMTKVLLDTVKNFLNRMNIEKNYDYIFNNSVSSPVLHARDTFDITSFVLEGLNAEYQKKYNTEDD